MPVGWKSTPPNISWPGDFLAIWISALGWWDWYDSMMSWMNYMKGTFRTINLRSRLETKKVTICRPTPKPETDFLPIGLRETPFLLAQSFMATPNAFLPSPYISWSSALSRSRTSTISGINLMSMNDWRSPPNSSNATFFISSKLSEAILVKLRDYQLLNGPLAIISIATNLWHSFTSLPPWQTLHGIRDFPLADIQYFSRWSTIDRTSEWIRILPIRFMMTSYMHDAFRHTHLRIKHQFASDCRQNQLQ